MSETADLSEDECLAVWCAGDDWCAVTCAMAVIGNKWHPVIVHRLLKRGPLRFNELANEIGGVTNKVLSESLEDLQQKGLVERSVINEKPVQVQYTLTERGQSLDSVIHALAEWGKNNLRPAPNQDESVC